MTRPTGEDAMSSEHVEVLREMLDDAAIEPPWEPEEVAAITAAIAALSAPKPEGDVVVTRNEGGEIVAVTRQDAEGRILSVIAESAPQPPAEAQPVAWLGANPRTGVPVMAVRTPAPSVMRDFAMRPLYANPPPSAPVGVEGFDEWFDEYTKNNYTDEMLALAAWKQALAQQPAAVDEDDFDCPHSAFDNCDCYADQQGGES